MPLVVQTAVVVVLQAVMHLLHFLSAALLVLIAAVMNADNEVKKSELSLVKRFLVSNYGEEKAKELLL